MAYAEGGCRSPPETDRRSGISPCYAWPMPADEHPFDALEKQFQMEGLSVSPVTKALVSVASLLPLRWPLDAAVQWMKDHNAADSLERMALMLDTCMKEVRKHDVEIRALRESLSRQGLEAKVEVSRALLLDAARKAEGTRSKERVRRIGIILANTIIEPKPPDEDEAEEMMRVAMELTDRDIELLRELIGVQGSLFEHGHVPRFQAHMAWEHASWGTRIDPELDSVFSKLESFGLVARIPPPNNLNLYADFQNRYVLLTKGLRFEKLIRQAAATDS